MVEFVDISKEISSDDIYVDGAKILIIIEKNQLDNLRKDKAFYAIIKEYLKGYIQTLKEYSKNIESALVNETQILDYLKKDEESRRFMKNILDSELKYIKANHPDFIKKWKYYNEFESMCAELDST